MKSFCLTILLGSIASSLRCPSKWRLYQSNCYRYYPQTKAFWSSSDFCRQQVFYSAHSNKPTNSELVSIHSQDENAFVFSIVPPKTTVQLGLYNNVIKGKRTWHWTDGSPFEYSNWAPGQPDRSIQHYGTMWNSKFPSKWDDAGWPSLSFVCKVLADDCLKSPYEESFHEFYYNGSEYTVYLLEQKEIWLDLKQICESSGGKLASITTDDELEAVLSFLRNNYPEGMYEIGLSRQAGLDRNVDANWKWETGEEFRSFIPWGGSDPDLSTSDYCAARISVSGKLWDIPATVINPNKQSKGYICEYDRSDCKNGGKLSDGGVCICPSPYSCLDCSWYNGCMSNPCQNGGQCINNEHSYSCECDDGFTGTHCEIYEGCLAFPCMNRGNCSKDPEKEIFVCTCPEDYSGVTCQTYIGHCKEDPCENGGTCHSISVEPFYICQCKPPYIGTMTCSDTSNDCLSNHCLNGGTCVTNEEKNGTSCLCSSDYSGSTCGLQKLTSKTDNQTSQSHTNFTVGFIVVIVLLTATILLLVGYILRNSRRKSADANSFIGLQHDLE